MPDTTGANGMREHFRVVGKPNIPGLTSYAMATGVAKYGTDYVVPGMLYAKILRSPYAHARAGHRGRGGRGPLGRPHF